MCDLHVPVRPGGDVALANAVLKRLIERGAVDEALRRRPHRRAGDELVAALGRPGRSTTCSPLAGVDRPSSTPSSTSYARAGARDPRVVDGHHPAPRRGRRRAGHRQPGPGPGQRRSRRRGPHADPRATRACRAAPRWAPTPPRCPGALPVDAEHAAALADAVGVPGARRARAHRARDGRGRRRAASSTCCGCRAATSSTCCPTRRRWRRRSAGCRCGSTRTWSSPRQMLVEGDDVLLLPVATRYEQEGGGTETTTERRIVFSPEIPRQVGEARSEWRLFADVATRVRPELRPAFSLARQPGPAAPRSPEWCRSTPASRRWPTPATRCSGAAATCARAASSPRRRAGAGSRALEPADADAARRRVRGRHPAGQAVQLDGARRGRPAHRRRARRRVHRRGRRRAPSASAAGDRVRLRSRDRHASTGTVKLARLPARTLQVHWPEGNVLIAGGADHREPASKVPDYNAVVTVEPLGTPVPADPAGLGPVQNGWMTCSQPSSAANAGLQRPRRRRCRSPARPPSPPARRR